MTAKISLSYDPPGEQLARFRASDALARGLIGPISGGRKICAVHDILLRFYQGRQRRCRWVAIRGSIDLLESETIPAWHRAVPPVVGDWDPKTLRHPFGFTTKAGTPKDFDIQFLAMDRPDHRRRLQTIEASGFWLDGARELDEWVFDLALENAGSWPLDERNSPAIICTSRMPREDHWLKTRGSDIALFHQPGGRTVKAENLKHLPQGYYTRLAQGRRPDWVRIYVDAEWDNARRAGTLEDRILQSYELPEQSLPMPTGTDWPSIKDPQLTPEMAP